VHAFVGAPSLLVAGAPSGPLAGCTLAVKDLFDVAGTVTGAGNPSFAAGRPPATHNAAAVQALVDAGASVVGKTITDELAYSLNGTNVHFGTPVNVAAPGRIPGGSSAGSAAAVAAGLVDLALGTDTGGSIRVPASYCGIVGWRPTHGAISLDGVVPLAPSFDTVGIFCRTTATLRDAADALLGPAPPVRAAVLSLHVLHKTDADAAPEVSRALRDLAAVTGAPAEPWHLGCDLAEAMAAFAAWSRPYRDQRASFLARPAAFDWPWIVQYAWRYLGDNPFGFKAICASSWLEAHGKSFRGVELPHIAVQDAELQLRHFLAHA
jgi:amidase